jgi:hypothetical protein
MLICFFDIRGIIHFEFVSKGTTVKQIFYVEVLKRLIDVQARRVVDRPLIDSSPIQHVSTFFASNVEEFSRKR